MGVSHDSVHDAAIAPPVRASWYDESANVGASSSRASLAEPAYRVTPAEPAHRAFLFADVSTLDDDDCALVFSEKKPLSEGLRSVLRLLFQLCPPAVSEALPPPQRTCDFEGLFASVSKPAAEKVPMNPFHQVAELLSETRLRFQTVLEAGKLPAAGLPPRLRGPGSFAEPMPLSATPFNSSLFRLVGSLSTKCSLNFSFDEATKVESLAKVLLDSQSMSFWFFSALLHWLKELGFVPPDSVLFEQLVQLLSLSFVGAASSSATLATYFEAKRHEGVLSHFPSHVRLHFRRDLASSSFSGPDLFDE